MSIDASAVARVVGITTTFKDLRGGVLFLPQRIAVFAQGASAKDYSLDKFTATNQVAVGSRFGWGSPAHLISRELHPANGDGVGTIPVTYYPLEDAYDAVAASGTITPAGSQTKAAQYRVKVGNVPSKWFVIPVGSTVAAVCDLIVAAMNAVLEMPVIAADNTTNVGLTAKWAGLSGNGMVVEVEGESLGTTFATVNTANGLVNPDEDQLNAALAQVGGVWESLGLNALNYNDTDALDVFKDWGEGRWLPTVRKPCVIFRGFNGASVATAIATTSTREDDRVNCQLAVESSTSLPFVIAARQLARIAKVANDNPARDYGSQKADGLDAGADDLQWTWEDRDAAVKGGSSTSEVKDGVVNVSDVVTSWAPEGESDPAYRHVCDIVKLQQVIFNLDLKFKNADWDGAPMIPDDQPTVNPDAKKPKMWKAEANGIIDNLGLQAILSDPAAAKKKTTCAIIGPKRYKGTVQVQLSGNANIADIDLEYGFFYGQQAVVG